MIELIFDNEEIVPFWKNFFESNSIEYRLNNITNFEINLEQTPEDIIYLNCTGKLSSYTNEIVRIEQYLDFLAIFNRNVVNDFNTVNYSFSLVEQYRLFKRFGLTYPLTVFSSEPDEFIEMSRKLPLPFHLVSNIPVTNDKENKFESVEDFSNFIVSDNFSKNDNDILLAQQYIPPKEDQRNRVLLVGGNIVYVYSSKIETDKKAIITDTAGLTQLLDKYIEMTTNSGYRLVEIEFVKANNNVLYTTSILPATYLYEELELETENAGMKAIIELIK